MKISRFILISTLILTLAGCGFHPRNADHFPPALDRLYIDSSNPYSNFQTLLNDNLRALHVVLVKKPEQAPITLVILSNVLSHSDPGLVSTNMAVPYSFTLTTTAELRSSKGEIITGPVSFSTTRTIVLNSSEVMNSSIGLSTQQDIVRNNIAKLYFWLISGNTQKALAHYANHRVRTQTTD